jgi:hypothetical protein
METPIALPLPVHHLIDIFNHVAVYETIPVHFVICMGEILVLNKLNGPGMPLGNVTGPWRDP